MIELSDIKININDAFEQINPYAVGGIYFSVSSTSPASIFGGTWTEYSGIRYVRLGKTDSDTYKAEVTGGSNTATHKHVMPLGFDDINCLYFWRKSDKNPVFESIIKTGSCILANFNVATDSSWWRENMDSPLRAAYTQDVTISTTPNYICFYAWKRTA